MIKDLLVKDCENQIIKLLNHRREPVGAIYLDKLKCNLEDLVVCESNSINEKYYLYINGVSVFFTYFEKIQTN